MEHRLRLRVRYGETDCMGRVYHPNYLSYMECGRVEMMREWGFDYAATEKEDECFLPVFEAWVKYRAPAEFDDEIEVVTTVTDFSFVRLTFAYEVRRVKDDVLCAEGRIVLAAVDKKGEPRRLPEDLRAFLQTFDLPPEKERRQRNRTASGGVS
ncbi:MAG: acyl-CoA thioesterase [Planctomycetota bacterium]|jgi:acyl-CoA thioester hydrolase